MLMMIQEVLISYTEQNIHQLLWFLAKCGNAIYQGIVSIDFSSSKVILSMSLLKILLMLIKGCFIDSFFVKLKLYQGKVDANCTIFCDILHIFVFGVCDERIPQQNYYTLAHASGFSFQSTTI